jgi:hypothetical protein
MRLLDRAANALGFLSKDQVAADISRYYAKGEDRGMPANRATTPLQEQLRALAETCDIARDCIEARKQMVLATPWEFQAIPGADPAVAAAEIEIAKVFYATGGGLGGPGRDFDEFTSVVVEDLLVIGATALYRRLTRGGAIFSVEPVDAATIEPLVDASGFPPEPPAPAYEQRINFQLRGSYTSEQLRYLRWSARSNSKYGRSPTEFAFGAISQYLGVEKWNAEWFRTGDGEWAYWQTPKDWTAAERKEFNAILAEINKRYAAGKRASDLSLPAGPERISGRPRAEAEYLGTSLRLSYRIAAPYNVTLTTLGFAGEQYKTTSEEQRRLSELWGNKPLLRRLEWLHHDIVSQDLGLTSIRLAYQTHEEDRESWAKSLGDAGSAIIATNEGREKMGLPRAEGPLVDALFVLRPDGTPLIIGYTGDAADATGIGAEQAETKTPAAEPASLEKAAEEDLRRWKRQALKYHREGHLEKALAFTSAAIPAERREQIAETLEKARTAEDVRAAFAPPDELGAVTGAVAERLLSAVREERGRRQGW